MDLREQIMTSWTEEELHSINADPDFHLAAALPDGSTPKWVRIWSVPVDNKIYVRSFNGATGKWFGPALASRRGRISAGGITKEVTFTPVDDDTINKAIDQSYRTKYAGSPDAETMSTEPVRRNTLEVTPAH